MAKIETAEKKEKARDLKALELLEKRVDKAVEVIRELRAERDGMRERAEAAEGRVRELEAQAADETVLEQIRQERDDLLHDRAGVAKRVESILARLEATGLD